MNFRNIDLKDRTVRRVFHRILIVASGVLCLLFWIILPHINHPHKRGTYDAEDASGVGLGYSILFYLVGHALYWGVYWILQGLQPKPPRRFFRRLYLRLINSFRRFRHHSAAIRSLQIFVMLGLAFFISVAFMDLHTFDDHVAAWLGLIALFSLLTFIIHCAISGHKIATSMKGGASSNFQYDEDDYSSLYMLRIIRNVAGDHGFSSSELLEDTFSSDDLEAAKGICLQRAQLFLETGNLGEWQESDIGFEIQYDDIRVMLVTDAHFIPAPHIGDAIEVSPR